MAKQMQIPGTEREKIKELDELGAEYVKHRDRRIKALQSELAVKEKLLAAMKEHKLTTYLTDDDDIIELKPGKEKLKVRHLDDEEEDDDSEE